jgi:hypothetical protein
LQGERLPQPAKKVQRKAGLFYVNHGDKRGMRYLPQATADSKNVFSYYKPFHSSRITTLFLA